MQRLFTALCEPPVGDVGNQAPSSSFATTFSRSPDSRLLDLENALECKPSSSQSLQKHSHISSVNYWYYYFYFYIFIPSYYP